jgi:hypothetical protein
MAMFNANRTKFGIRISALSVLGLLASCGGVPAGPDSVDTDPGETTENFAVGPGDVFSALLGLTSALQKHTDLLGEMEPSLQELNHKLDAIEEHVIQVSQLVKQAEMRAIKREIDGDRQQTIVAGLFHMREFPAEAHSLELAFEGIAEKYDPKDENLPDWYFFTGVRHDTTTRFDHRLAQPTFILAVDAWIQARFTAGDGLSGAARTTLHRFADELDGNVNKIRSRVTCSKVRVPAGKGHPCRINDVFRDAIEEDNIAGKSVACSTTAETAAHCTAVFQVFRYNPPAITAIAALWRKIADETPSARNVFVTSAAYSGNLGGLAGADAKCQAHANSAGLSGAYKAWLSDATGSPSTRFSKTGGPFVLAKRNIVVANNWAEWASATHQHALDSNENGSTSLPLGTAPCSFSTGGGHQYWSNTDVSGANAFPLNCNNWTTSVDTAPDGPLVGRTDVLDGGWALWCHGTGMCASSSPLLCVQQ